MMASKNRPTRGMQTSIHAMVRSGDIVAELLDVVQRMSYPVADYFHKPCGIKRHLQRYLLSTFDSPTKTPWRP